jgi:hypothetical protein
VDYEIAFHLYASGHHAEFRPEWVILYLQATRDIQAGEEIIADYGMDYWK